MQQIQTNPTDEGFLLVAFANRLSRWGAFLVFLFLFVKKNTSKMLEIIKIDDYGKDSSTK